MLIGERRFFNLARSFDVPETGQRIISTSYEAYKEGMVWRSMLNKKIVSKDLEKLL